jgi:hypothetical protein
MIEIAQDERRIRDRDRLVDRTGKIDAGVDHVDRAEAQRLVDLVFIAELRGRENLDFVTAIGAFLDFFAGPHRIGVVGLVDFVNVCPFQFGLCRDRPGQAGRDNQQRGSKRQMAQTYRHGLPSRVCVTLLPGHRGGPA